MRKEASFANAVDVKFFDLSDARSPVRVQLIDGESWFVAKDVCKLLGIVNHRNAVSRLDDDEKLTGEIFQSGQGCQMWFVNESGLYHLIFQSRKSEAKKFRKWVTGEVLPKLRMPIEMC